MNVLLGGIFDSVGTRIMEASNRSRTWQVGARVWVYYSVLQCSPSSASQSQPVSDTSLKTPSQHQHHVELALVAESNDSCTNACRTHVQRLARQGKPYDL